MRLTAFVLHVEYTYGSITALNTSIRIAQHNGVVSPSRNDKYQSRKEAGLAFALSDRC